MNIEIFVIHYWNIILTGRGGAKVGKIENLRFQYTICLFLTQMLFLLYMMKIKQYKRVIDPELPTKNLVIIYFMLHRK